MPDLASITLPNNVTYDFKDTVARASIPSASTATPLEDGTASAGSSADYAKGDHRHPHDSSKQDTIEVIKLL